MSSQSFLSGQPELVQLAVHGILVVLGLYLLIAFLRLFTQSRLERRVRSCDGGRCRRDQKRGEAYRPPTTARAEGRSAAGATGNAASDE